MILYQGKLYESSEQDNLLDRLEEDINLVRLHQKLTTQEVIDALAQMGDKIASGVFDTIIQELAIEGIERYIGMLILMLKKETLTYKVESELGQDFFVEWQTNPPLGQTKVGVKPMPLGTIFHIAAGNMDGLPVFSVAEGLLTGNVNILKLPQADNGLSIQFFLKLIEIQPKLKDFIYVFDTPSSDFTAMIKMGEMSDGIVTWGGDDSIAAVRKFAKPGTKLIEWGHKLGFAYISGYEDKEAELTALAEHIFITKQLLCNSCQTIYLDTDKIDDVHQFCVEFLPYMEASSKKYLVNTIGSMAEITLRRYSDEIMGVLAAHAANSTGENNADNADKQRPANKTYQARGCSLMACHDSELELSYMFGNCLVKRLPKDQMMSVLRRNKGYLQTAGLICAPEEREELVEILARAGVVRIMRAGNMSESYCGEAHDGEYPLRRYTRIVNVEP